MSPIMYSARRIAASITLCAVCVVFPGPVLATQVVTPTVDQVTIQGIHLASPAEKLETAHHGGEGLGGAAGAAGAATVAPLLNTVSGRVQKATVVTDSLYGTMLLTMAYQRDEELQKLVRCSGRVNAMTMVGVAGISGLALGQSIYSYRNVEPQTIDVTPAHHPGGHDHVHMSAESKVPSTLGIIGSGVTLAALGVQAIFNKVYAKKIEKRQAELQAQVENILSRLEAGNENYQGAQQDLSLLVGERASREFLALWKAVYANL